MSGIDRDPEQELEDRAVATFDEHDHDHRHEAVATDRVEPSRTSATSEPVIDEFADLRRWCDQTRPEGSVWVSRRLLVRLLEECS